MDIAVLKRVMGLIERYVEVSEEAGCVSNEIEEQNDNYQRRKDSLERTVTVPVLIGPAHAPALVFDIRGDLIPKVLEAMVAVKLEYASGLKDVLLALEREIVVESQRIVKEYDPHPTDEEF